MAISRQVEEFLRTHQVKFNVITHERAVTAQDTAKKEHVSGKQVAKVVMVEVDRKVLMTVVPANRRLSLMKLKAEMNAKNVRVLEEREFESLFPGCETGAEPPLGCIYHLPMYVDQKLLEDNEIVFNAGNHEDSILISVEDFKRVSDAGFGDISAPSR